MQPSRNDELRKAYRITAIIGVAMLASLIVYAIVVELIKLQNAPFNGYAPLLPDVFAILRYVLMGVAIVEFFTISILYKLILSAKAQPNSSPAAVPFSPDVQRLVSASIVTYALCESIAIYGLVLFFIQGNSYDFYFFLVASFVCFAVYFPRYGKWEEWLAEKERERSRRPQM